MEPTVWDVSVAHGLLYFAVAYMLLYTAKSTKDHAKKMLWLGVKMLSVGILIGLSAFIILITYL